MIISITIPQKCDSLKIEMIKKVIIYYNIVRYISKNHYDNLTDYVYMSLTCDLNF